MYHGLWAKWVSQCSESLKSSLSCKWRFYFAEWDTSNLHWWTRYLLDTEWRVLAGIMKKLNANKQYNLTLAVCWLHAVQLVWWVGPMIRLCLRCRSDNSSVCARMAVELLTCCIIALVWPSPKVFVIFGVNWVRTTGKFRNSLLLEFESVIWLFGLAVMGKTMSSIFFMTVSDFHLQKLIERLKRRIQEERKIKRLSVMFWGPGICLIFNFLSDHVTHC